MNQALGELLCVNWLNIECQRVVISEAKGKNPKWAVVHLGLFTLFEMC